MEQHGPANGASAEGPKAAPASPAPDDEYTRVHFRIGEVRETACFRPDQVTDSEIKELFRSAAEAGPLDIVKLRKGDKILNISPHLPGNTVDDPYILEVVGAHPASLGMLDADLLRALERRVAALERELRDHQEAAATGPCLALRELKRQVDTFKKKLETTEHLSWLGFYKQLPEPVSSEACRRLQYRRKSDSVKRKVREKFLNICDVAVSSSVREWLRSPAFDARQWEDEELLLMLQTMFIELELPQKFSIPLSTLRNFIYEVYNNYNEVPFHNFRHCFCVAQMMYAMVWAVDLVSKIGDLEVLVLIASCICHDLDHPGYNNIYQINARTELALRYNDISPLENHHCSVAFRILEAPECNILSSLDAATFRTVREGIIRCILATDMARHNEILAQFTDAVPDFDFTSKVHINLLSMVLIKVADISNEARPMDVAEPWLDSLLQEFFKQSDAEKLEGLPVTPFMDRDKVTKPSSQCSFIGLVLLPLFEILGDLFPELQELIVEPVRYALDYYRRLNEAAKDERHQRKSVVELQQQQQQAADGPGAGPAAPPGLRSASSTGSVGTGCVVVKSTSSHSMRSRRSTGTLHSRSRSIEDQGLEGPRLDEAGGSESSDPETATEVEVSEKTLKFKISTEGNVGAAGAPGRKSYPGSRKGSREKSSLDYHNHDLAKAMREHESERRRSRGENLGSDVSSPASARSLEEPRILEELPPEPEPRLLDLVFAPPEVCFEGNGGLLLDTAQQRRNNRPNKRTASVDSNEAASRGHAHKDPVKDVVRCCCEEKPGPNNKSLLSRLRNLTDRLSMSFDSREAPAATAATPRATRLPGAPGPSRPCKRCSPAQLVEKRSMTLPKARRSQDSRNKSWRTVFAKEKRPSVSLEALPAGGGTGLSTDAKRSQEAEAPTHRRHLSDPEGDGRTGPPMSFAAIDVRPSKPEIHVEPANPGSSSTLEDIGKVEIRRSSASMEDISKITKQGDLGGLLEQQRHSEEEQQHGHAGSLDSMLRKETLPGPKRQQQHQQHQQQQQQQLQRQQSASPAQSGSPQAKKSSPGLFSRFKSGMSIDGAGGSNSGSLHEQQQQQQQGWISSLTASFRPRRQGEQQGAAARPPSREEVD